jgi:membrane-associated protease RseP (regulator of RpoE activity)
MKKPILVTMLFVLIYSIGIVAALKSGYVVSTEKIVYYTALISVGFSILLIVYLYRRFGGKSVVNQTELAKRDRLAVLSKAIPRLQIAVIVLIILLISGLYQSRGEPLALRLGASAINLSITLLLIVSIRRAKRVIKTNSERME